MFAGPKLPHSSSGGPAHARCTAVTDITPNEVGVEERKRGADEPEGEPHRRGDRRGEQWCPPKIRIASRASWNIESIVTATFRWQVEYQLIPKHAGPIAEKNHGELSAAGTQASVRELCSSASR